MQNDQIIEKTADYVRKTMKNGDVGHDWFHVERVWKMARKIGQEENASMIVVELAALLHDIADWKFHDEGVGEKLAVEWLEGLGINKTIVDDVIHIIENISFKGSAEKEKMKTLEGRVVQDSDRLDALGAFGVARAFTFAGHKNIPIFAPGVKPRENMTFKQYKETEGSAINHFYEKLLLLKDRMNTKTGKRLAEGRHKFMEIYLEQFFKEAEGER